MSNDNISEDANEQGGSGTNNSHRPKPAPEQKQPQPGDVDDKSGQQPQGLPR
jgi:hypothetical protein